MYSREIINELNKLSKEVFGSSSKWRKMIEKGVGELTEEDTKKLEIIDGKEISKIVKTPKMHVGDGGGELHQYNLKHYTVESVKEFMLMVLDRRAQMQQAIKRLEEQKKAEEAIRKAAEEASGTAV